MTKTAIMRHRVRDTAWMAVALLVLPVALARAVQLDDRGEMRLLMRAYTDVRIGTEKEGGSDDPLSFPRSAAGHVRQHRYFLELKFDHDIKRFATAGTGVARAFGWLDPDTLKYSLQYRGEGEGIYDYGPREWSDQFAVTRALRLDFPRFPNTGPALTSPTIPDGLIHQRIAFLRRVARQRHRFFLGYVDLGKGPVDIRIGRQILAWGETDNFRLLDNINPLDNGFGGFFIPLDERRVPLDMARGSYHFGSIGPIADAFLEGFAALGNRVSTLPGIPPGSPWEPGGLGRPNPAIRTVVDVPGADDVRGGGRFVFTAHDVTYTLAHYYTYLDTPGVRFQLPGTNPRFALPLPKFEHEIIATQRFPRVPITGGSLTFPIPSYYAIVRSEAAWFQGEPMNRQGRGNSADSTVAPGTPGFARLQRANNIEGGLDPFVYPRFLDLTRKKQEAGRLLQRDTFNYNLGFDVNRFIRFLNPAQTFFITTQFFYKHIFDSPGDLVLPVPFRNIPVDKSFLIIGTQGPLGIGCPTASGGKRPCSLRPRLIHLQDDQFLHTLLITTSYYGGRIVPIYTLFYDWQGAILNQPGISYIRDPFRFTFDYTRIDGPATGQVGTLRDRDNVRFQVEFVF